VRAGQASERVGGAILQPLPATSSSRPETRAPFRKVGGFDEEFNRAEDDELALRLSQRGRTFRYQPAAMAWHYPGRTRDVWHLQRRQEVLAERLERHGMGAIIDNLPSDGSLPLFWTNHHHLGARGCTPITRGVVIALAMRTADMIRRELGEPPLPLSEAEVRDHR
jgi:hypothetical protein